MALTPLRSFSCFPGLSHPGAMAICRGLLQSEFIPSQLALSSGTHSIPACHSSSCQPVPKALPDEYGNVLGGFPRAWITNMAFPPPPFLVPPSGLLLVNLRSRIHFWVTSAQAFSFGCREGAGPHEAELDSRSCTRGPLCLTFQGCHSPLLTVVPLGL